MKQEDTFILVEKYRPNTLDEVEGNFELKNKIKEYIEKQDIPNLLFYSKSAGTGKCLAFLELIDVEIDISKDEYEILKEYEIK